MTSPSNATWRIAPCALAFLLVTTAAVAQPVVTWKRVIGSTRDDQGTGISFDGLGGVYISGQTTSSLGSVNAGSLDVFVAKYDTAGTQTWIRQFGSDAFDTSSGVSSDRLGNIFFVGDTQGALGGPPSSSLDSYLAKLSADGNLQWIRQPAPGTSESVSADGLGNAYVSGGIRRLSNDPDATIEKYDSSGNRLWSQQSGAAGRDISRGVSAAEQDSAYSTGFISPQPSSADSQDYFLTKYDRIGNSIWTRQVGSAAMDQAIGVAADGLGSVYVCGVTKGMLGDTAFGVEDAFVSKFDATGNLLWTRQLSSNIREFAFAIATDQNSNVYIGGNIGAPETGTITDSDSFVTKFDADGNVKWTYQMVGATWDAISGLALDGLGSVYAVGHTRNSMFSNDDAFVMKIIEIPEPETHLLSLFLASAILTSIAIGRTKHCPPRAGRISDQS